MLFLYLLLAPKGLRALCSRAVDQGHDAFEVFLIAELNYHFAFSLAHCHGYLRVKAV